MPLITIDNSIINTDHIVAVHWGNTQREHEEPGLLGPQYITEEVGTITIWLDATYLEQIDRSPAQQINSLRFYFEGNAANVIWEYLHQNGIATCIYQGHE